MRILIITHLFLATVTGLISWKVSGDYSELNNYRALAGGTGELQSVLKQFNSRK